MLLSEFKPTKKATKVVESRITEEPMEFGPETGNELYPAGYENDGRLILHVVTELLPRIKDDQMSLDVMKAVDAIEAGKGNKADIKTNSIYRMYKASFLAHPFISLLQNLGIFTIILRIQKTETPTITNIARTSKKLIIIK